MLPAFLTLSSKLSNLQDFRDARVCKSFLLGLCPHALFTNTKEDLGPCPLEHDERLKKAYQEASKTHDFGYDRDLERTLERLLADAERKIAKGRERVVEEDPGVSGFIPRIDVDSAPELLDITHDMADKTIEQEEATDRGDFEKAAQLAEDVEELRRRKYELQARLLLSKATDEDRKSSSTNKQRLRVCDVCGAFLSLHDSEERIADHFGGRSHLGYQIIRQKLSHVKEWRKTVRASVPGGSVPSSAHDGAGGGGDYDRRGGGGDYSRDRHRSRSRERPREEYRSGGGGGGGGYRGAGSSSGYGDRSGGGGGYSGGYGDRDRGGDRYERREGGGGGGGYRDDSRRDGYRDDRRGDARDRDRDRR